MDCSVAALATADADAPVGDTDADDVDVGATGDGDGGVSRDVDVGKCPLIGKLTEVEGFFLSCSVAMIK